MLSVCICGTNGCIYSYSNSVPEPPSCYRLMSHSLNILGSCTSVNVCLCFYLRSLQRSTTYCRILRKLFYPNISRKVFIREPSAPQEEPPETPPLHFYLSVYTCHLRWPAWNSLHVLIFSNTQTTNRKKTWYCIQVKGTGRNQQSAAQVNHTGMEERHWQPCRRDKHSTKGVWLCSLWIRPNN